MTDKMTIEQAIICLDFFKSDNPLVDKSERLKLALEMAIEALEKQIPKKTVAADSIWKGTKVTMCATCCHPFGTYDENDEVGKELTFDVLKLQNKWCPECGQAIDWESDTDERK